MVESRTARMRLVQWSSGTDSPQRVDFNETFLNIETLAAIDQQGTLNNRPNPNKAGMYYFATDNGTLYRSDGTSWAVVGASVLSQLVRPIRTDAVAHTVQGLVSQTADLKRVLDSANVIYQRVRSNGDFIHGPLRISQAGRTTTGTEVVPTHSATTVDNASSGMWGLTLSNTTGNTAGFLRGLRGGAVVFSVSPTGVITAPAVNLTSEPSSDSHATTKKYVDDKIGSTVYPLDGPQLSGVLGVAKGGTGGTTQATARSGIGAAASATTIATGAGLTGGGNLSANRTLSVVFWPSAGGGALGSNGVEDVAARADHTHTLSGARITGTLPIDKGGTNATTAAAARTSLGAAASATTFTAGTGLSGGGTLGANRTFNVNFWESGGTNTGGTNGASDSAARADHMHNLAGSTIYGTLPVANGGTGRSTLTSGSYLVGNGTGLTVLRTPAEVLANIGAATSGHGHALTDANITGTLPVSQGGTGATTAAAARSSLAAASNAIAINTGNGLTGGGNLTASRTISVQFAGSGSANTVARSDHKHAFSEILERLTAEQMPKAVELGSGVDLNTITTDGDYSQSHTAEASSGTNYPLGSAGWLRVVTSESGSMVWQKYTNYHPSNPTEYVRTWYNGLWGAWRQMADVNDIAALVNVYAAKNHGHSLTDSNITGTLPISQGGTGATTAAAARSALSVPSTSVSVNAGAGLSGGGNFSSSRTLQVVFEGNGSKSTAARSDHSHNEIVADGVGRLVFGTGGIILQDGSGAHVLTAYNSGQVLFNKAGVNLTSAGAFTGASIPWSDITSKPSTFPPSGHGHKLTDSNITGILPVAQGGTGANNPGGARTALDVPSRGIVISAGSGLTGGGSLAASRTINVDFSSGTEYGASQGVGTKVARFDHQHELSGSRIIGNLPWEKNSIPISLSTEDLDTLTNTAVYHQGSNANATSARNYPSSVAGLLEVTAHSNMVYQTYTDYSSSGSMWRRTRYGTTWYSWKRMIDERDLAEGKVFRNMTPVATTISSSTTGYANVAVAETVTIPTWASRAIVRWSISHFWSNGTTSAPNRFWGQTRFSFGATGLYSPDMGLWLSSTAQGTRHEVHRAAEIDVSSYRGTTRSLIPQMRLHPDSSVGSVTIATSSDVTVDIDFRP